MPLFRRSTTNNAPSSPSPSPSPSSTLSKSSTTQFPTKSSSNSNSSSSHSPSPPSTIKNKSVSPKSLGFLQENNPDTKTANSRRLSLLSTSGGGGIASDTGSIRSARNSLVGNSSQRRGSTLGPGYGGNGSSSSAGKRSLSPQGDVSRPLQGSRSDGGLRSGEEDKTQQQQGRRVSISDTPSVSAARTGKSGSLGRSGGNQIKKAMTSLNGGDVKQNGKKEETEEESESGSGSEDSDGDQFDEAEEGSSSVTSGSSSSESESDSENKKSASTPSTPATVASSNGLKDKKSSTTARTKGPPPTITTTDVLSSSPPTSPIITTSPPQSPTSGPSNRSRSSASQSRPIHPPLSARPTPTKKPLNQLTFDDVKLSDEDLRSDIDEIWVAMHLFLNSRMIEAEDICLSECGGRLYFSVGYSLIQCIKSLMTFEPEDLSAAISTCRDSLLITSLLRLPTSSLSFASVSKLVRGTSSLATIKTMNQVQRHAELVYAECVLLKAIIGIIYSGDFVAFLKEAINMRNAYAVYRMLAKYVEEADKEWVQKQSKGGSKLGSLGGKLAGNGKSKDNSGSDEDGDLDEDPAIDPDFRSGVHLGNGLISMILSLLPSNVLKIMEVFGFTGDREYAIETLMKPGGWVTGQREPNKGPPLEELGKNGGWGSDANSAGKIGGGGQGKGKRKEGVRRQICDMALLFYHLVIPSYLPVGGVDVKMADSILHYNLKRYPQGVFFLYFSGRLYSTQTMAEKGIKQFQLAIKAQREYIQLQHICLWDMALTSLATCTWAQAYQGFNVLDKESNWSKAIYAYAKAITLYEQGKNDEATKIMKFVPDLMQRIAGKSIPLEKFVARKSKKYLNHGNKLICPGIELAYCLNCLNMAPRYALFEEHLDAVSVALSELHQQTPEEYEGEYWDDYCLAHLLRGIVLHFIAHPEAHTSPDPPEPQIPVEEAEEQAMISYNNVFKHGREINQDHHVVWFAHYQLGRLYDSMGDYVKAKKEYDLVMSGKGMEIGPRKGKGKVSLQNMVVLRTNAALQKLIDEKKI